MPALEELVVADVPSAWLATLSPSGVHACTSAMFMYPSGDKDSMVMEATLAVGTKPVVVPRHVPGANLPAVHVVHIADDVAVAALLYDPAAQAVQVAVPVVSALYVPTTQAVQPDVPVVKLL